MNWPLRALIFSLLTALVSACGVKGDPLPPEKPADLGRGRPTYKKAAEKVKIIPARQNEKEEEEEDHD